MGTNVNFYQILVLFNIYFKNVNVYFFLQIKVGLETVI